MFKKVFIFLFIFAASFCRIFADEGMWLPLLLQSLNEKEMQDKGFKLTVEDIYSINHSSMKDAVVLFGRGCTAEIVSDQGLIFTNHHCGYGQIQSHSSIDHDYLTYGFWAMNTAEELACPGLTATILVRMEDVTKKVQDFLNSEMTNSERDIAISKICKTIEDEAINGTHYKAQVKPFYYGNEFYLLVYEVFTDVRLVGAPPSEIGKFGGDTDNWMWPRHTGDFSVFRIYANSENKPSDFSKNNVAYKPKYTFPISLKGVKKNDFTFVFGYPGRTEHFTISEGVKIITEDENPIAIDMRRNRLDIMDKYMKSNVATRIQYANKYAGVANYWKKMIGENKGIRQWNGIEGKLEQEKAFNDIINKDKSFADKYGSLLKNMNLVYEGYKPFSLANIYFSEGFHSIEIMRFANGVRGYIELCKKKSNPKLIEQEKNRIEKTAQNFFASYNVNIDEEIATKIMPILEDMKTDFLPKSYLMLKVKYHGDWQKAMKNIYSKSFFSVSDDLNKFLKLSPKKAIKAASKDPIYMLTSEFYDNYFEKISPGITNSNSKLDSLYRIYVGLRRHLNSDERMYPDANSTLRVAYGNVNGFQAADGINYNYFTTTDGILEKSSLDIEDYYISPKLKDMFDKKDFGIYADSDGTMHTGFIATNHTTGGNSGSPVLNANGELIGINFDRVWEGTMSDLMFDPNKCRNISVDIRYCLWVIDKYAGAGYLLNEMKIIK